MKRQFICLTVTTLLCHWFAPPAQAQPVQVGPGFVRAPYVGVYLYPGGGLRVQAPYVDRYWPGYQREFRDDRFPSGSAFSQMSWQALSQAVRDWAVWLEADLNRYPSGQFWKSSLKTAEIAALVPASQSKPPTEVVRRRLQEISAMYQSLAAAPQVNRVVQLASFQNLWAAVAEYSTPPEQRLRRQLLLSAGELNRTLARFQTADSWQQYLQLKPGQALSPDYLGQSAQAPTADSLARVLGRFDSASKDDQNRVITTLPAYKQTRERLAAYLAERGISPSAFSEELPPPNPSQAPADARPLPQN